MSPPLLIPPHLLAAADRPDGAPNAAAAPRQRAHPLAPRPQLSHIVAQARGAAGRVLADGRGARGWGRLTRELARCPAVTNRAASPRTATAGGQNRPHTAVVGLQGRGACRTRDWRSTFGVHVVLRLHSGAGAHGLVRLSGLGARLVDGRQVHGILGARRPAGLGRRTLWPNCAGETDQLSASWLCTGLRRGARRCSPPAAAGRAADRADGRAWVAVVGRQRRQSVPADCPDPGGRRGALSLCRPGHLRAHPAGMHMLSGPAAAAYALRGRMWRNLCL